MTIIAIKIITITMKDEEKDSKTPIDMGGGLTMTTTSGQNGSKDSKEEPEKKIDKEQLKLMGGFLRHRLEEDPFYVAKIFVKMLGKNIWRIATRIAIILTLAYTIRHVLVTYTTIPSFYSTLILIFLIIVYYTRQEKNYATKYMIRFMLLIGADRFITYNLNKPPGTMIVLLIIGGLFYMTYAALFTKVKEDANHEPNEDNRGVRGEHNLEA